MTGPPRPGTGSAVFGLPGVPAIGGGEALRQALSRLSLPLEGKGKLSFLNPCGTFLAAAVAAVLAARF